MTALRELSEEGPRVLVRTVRPGDVPGYRRAVQASRARLSRWNPVDPDDLLRHLARQSDVHRTFLVLAHDPEGGHGVVGRINLTNIIRGRFQSGVLGYDAFDPYAGRGLFAEGLSLVVGLALRSAAEGGAGLHRVEANVQPGNARSAGLLRSLGFRHEGRTPRMLLLGAPGEGERWRDHERYAITAEQWPAQPYAAPERPRLVVLVGGPATERRAALAAGLSTELGLPRLVGAPWPDDARTAPADTPPDPGVGASVGASAGASGAAAAGVPVDASGAAATGVPVDDSRAAAAGVPVQAARAPLFAGGAPAYRPEPVPPPDPTGLEPATLWAVLAGCPTGAVVDVPCGPGAAPELQAGLHRAGVQVADAVQVWCADPARRADGGEGWGLGRTVPLAPDAELTAGEITRVALEARAVAAR